MTILIDNRIPIRMSDWCHLCIYNSVKLHKRKRVIPLTTKCDFLWELILTLLFRFSFFSSAMSIISEPFYCISLFFRNMLLFTVGLLVSVFIILARVFYVRLSSLHFAYKALSLKLKFSPPKGKEIVSKSDSSPPPAIQSHNGGKGLALVVKDEARVETFQFDSVDTVHEILTRNFDIIQPSHHSRKKLKKYVDSLVKSGKVKDVDNKVTEYPLTKDNIDEVFESVSEMIRRYSHPDYAGAVLSELRQYLEEGLLVKKSTWKGLSLLNINDQGLFLVYFMMKIRQRNGLLYFLVGPDVELKYASFIIKASFDEFIDVIRQAKDPRIEILSDDLDGVLSDDLDGVVCKSDDESDIFQKS